MDQDDQRSGREQARDGIREGVRAVTGFLAALKDAIDETIRDVKASGDLDPDRAREAVRSTFKRAANAMDDVKERLDFVPRKEFDALREELNALKQKVSALESRREEKSRRVPVDEA